MNYCTYCESEFFTSVKHHADSPGHKDNVLAYRSILKDMLLGEGLNERREDDELAGDNGHTRFSRIGKSIKSNNKKARIR